MTNMAKVSNFCLDIVRLTQIFKLLVKVIIFSPEFPNN